MGIIGEFHGPWHRTQVIGPPQVDVEHELVLWEKDVHPRITLDLKVNRDDLVEAVADIQRWNGVSSYDHPLCQAMSLPNDYLTWQACFSLGWNLATANQLNPKGPRPPTREGLEPTLESLPGIQDVGLGYLEPAMYKAMRNCDPTETIKERETQVSRAAIYVALALRAYREETDGWLPEAVGIIEARDNSHGVMLGHIKATVPHIIGWIGDWNEAVTAEYGKVMSPQQLYSEVFLKGITERHAQPPTG